MSLKTIIVDKSNLCAMLLHVFQKISSAQVIWAFFVVVLLPPFLKFECFSQPCDFMISTSLQIYPFVLFGIKSHRFGTTM